MILYCHSNNHYSSMLHTHYMTSLIQTAQCLYIDLFILTLVTCRIYIYLKLNHVFQISVKTSSSCTMPEYCCVPGCSSATGGHGFPRQSKSPERRKAWIIAVRRVDQTNHDKLWEPSAASKVCKKHFLEEDYKPSLLGIILVSCSYCVT